MGEKTLIAWTDATVNFLLGCSRVSQGCAKCYAATFASNRMGKPQLWRGERQVTKGPWLLARRLQREASAAGVRKRVFCGSMFDFFEAHPTNDATRPAMWDLIRACPNLDWQILTKRPERIAANLPADWGPDGWPHVWLGTSIEDARVVERAAHLVAVPAVVRFVSYEPALGPLAEALAPFLGPDKVGWVVYGGESGPGHRPEGTVEDPKCWARAMHAACAASGAAYFHKQSSAIRTEMGIELDGKIVREYPLTPFGRVV